MEFPSDLSKKQHGLEAGDEIHIDTERILVNVYRGSRPLHFWEGCVRARITGEDHGLDTKTLLDASATYIANLYASLAGKKIVRNKLSRDPKKMIFVVG